jgi:hypothetical protein
VTESEKSVLVDKIKKFSEAWGATIIAISGTATLVGTAGTAITKAQAMGAPALWLGVGAGAIGLGAATFYSHHRRRVAERERDEARASAAKMSDKIPTAAQLAATWPLERALKVDLLSNDLGHPAVIRRSRQTDVKIYVRLMNRGPFSIKPRSLTLKWVIEREDILLRGTKEVIDSFELLEQGCSEIKEIQFTADAITGSEPIPFVRIGFGGNVVCTSEVWDGNAKADIGAFALAEVRDATVEAIQNAYGRIGAKYPERLK